MPENEKPETETETTETDKASKEFLQPTSLPSTPKAPPGMLTRPSDLTTRPGFRSPPNAKSKAQKAAKKKK